MIKKRLLFPCLLILANSVSAQSVKPENLVQISYTPQQFFNSRYIVNDDAQPNPLSTNNTKGYNVGLSYQRVTKLGLTFSYGVQYGKQEHDIYINSDLSNFDPEAKRALKTAQFQDQHHFQLTYFNQRFMVGYIKPLPIKGFKGWSAEIKIGIGIKALNGATQDSSERMSIAYELDNGSSEMRVRKFYAFDPRIGNADNSRVQLNPGRNSFTHTYEANLGLRKEFNAGYLKSLAFGIEYTRSIRQNDFMNSIWITSYDNQENIISKDFYYNKSLSLGFYVGANFWFK